MKEGLDKEFEPELGTEFKVDLYLDVKSFSEIGIELATIGKADSWWVCSVVWIWRVLQ